CFLFTDAANPTSNHIYQQIGYEPVCACRVWKFMAPLTYRLAGIEEILVLRHAILRNGLPIETARFAGDEAESSYHAGAFTEGGRCVGCATLHRDEHEGSAAYRLRGMAVAQDVQGQGIGS